MDGNKRNTKIIYFSLQGSVPLNKNWASSFTFHHRKYESFFSVWYLISTTVWDSQIWMHSQTNSDRSILHSRCSTVQSLTVCFVASFECPPGKYISKMSKLCFSCPDGTYQPTSSQVTKNRQNSVISEFSQCAIDVNCGGELCKYVDFSSDSNFIHYISVK